MSSSNEDRLLAHPFPGTYEADDRVLTRRFTYAMGSFLFVSGVWGFVSPLVLGFLTSNPRRAIIETLLGLIGLKLALTRVTYEYLMLTGALLVAIGVAAFLPGTREFAVALLAASPAVGSVYLVLGGAAILLASTGKTASR